MKAFLGISIAALLAASPVQAGDTWTGPYIGANVGFAHSSTDVDLSHATGAIFYGDAFDPSTGSLGSDNGLAGGLEVGYDHQFQNIVLGFAADITWSDTDNGGTFTTPAGSQWTIASSPEMFGTLRGKLGYLVQPNLLVYATGGLAWGQFNVSQATDFVEGSGCSVDCAGGRTSGTFAHLGYVIGGGTEIALSEHWSLKGEYLYVDLGSEDYQLKGETKPGSGIPYVETFSAEQQMHIIRAGLNWHF